MNADQFLPYVPDRFKVGCGAVDVVGFYDRHPINEAQILDALRRSGRGPDGLAPEDLFGLDQDHYGGLAAVDALARRAGIGNTSRVLDVCSGLGGPARFLAWRFGCAAVGVDLNAGRVAGARRLTRMVGLQSRVRFVRGDATRLPFAPRTFDACVSQEAWLHVEDKGRVIVECRRVLRSGGRLAFTDWVARSRLGDRERARLREWMAATTVPSLDGYRSLLARAGFTTIDVEDLSREWIGILRERLQMYRSLRADTIARFGQARYDEYDQLYEFFVGLVADGKLGGGRFTATA
jgi:ubiquinone/menaquinone biosynthesis C-methylase UbiE